MREPALTKRVDQDAMAEMMKVASRIAPGDASRTFISLSGLQQAVSANLLGPQTLVQLLEIPVMSVKELKQHLTSCGVDPSTFQDKDKMQRELKRMIYRRQSQDTEEIARAVEIPTLPRKIGLLRKKSAEGNITKDESQMLGHNDEVHILNDLQRLRSESVGNDIGAPGEEPESHGFIEALVKQKLNDPDMIFTIHESLQCLDHCIHSRLLSHSVHPQLSWSLLRQHSSDCISMTAQTNCSTKRESSLRAVKNNHALHTEGWLRRRTNRSPTQMVSSRTPAAIRDQLSIARCAGGKYDGQFKDGKRDGQGTLTYADGEQPDPSCNQGSVEHWAVCRGQVRRRVQR